MRRELISRGVWIAAAAVGSMCALFLALTIYNWKLQQALLQEAVDAGGTVYYEAPSERTFPTWLVETVQHWLGKPTTISVLDLDGTTLSED